MDENAQKPTASATHRHTSEIEQELSAAAGGEVVVSFTPHLLPIKRGIISTIYAVPKVDEAAAIDAYAMYKDEPFVHVYENGALPEIKRRAQTTAPSVLLLTSVPAG